MAPSFTRPFIVVCVLAAANSLSLVKNEALKPDGDDNQALIHSRRQQGSDQGDGNPMAGNDDVQWSDSKDPWGAMTSQAMAMTSQRWPRRVQRTSQSWPRRVQKASMARQMGTSKRRSR